MSRRWLAAFAPFTFVLIASHVAQAKVFNFARNSYATYLRGGYGNNNAGKGAYQPGFPATVTFPDNNGMYQDYQGELGFAWTVSNSMTFRLGAEVLYPMMQVDNNGKNAVGNPLVIAQNQVFALIPQLDLEIYFANKNSFRAYFGAGGGYAYATVKNSIAFTAAGNAAFPGLVNYTEEGTGYNIYGRAFLGFEFAFFDNVGFSVDAGYKYLRVDNFYSVRNTVTCLRTYIVGDKLMNNDGTARTVDFSGAYIAGTFRFYL